eukprot:9501002-Pyramimonas_sp.AAC.1
MELQGPQADGEAGHPQGQEEAQVPPELLEGSSDTGLQETRAASASMEVLIERPGRKLHCFTSCIAGGREDAGGAATIVPGTNDGYTCDFVPDELVPGRILRLPGT